MVFVDESAFYLLPMAVHTYAPCGQTPVLRVPLSYDHLSAMGGITPEGRIFMQIRDHSYKGPDVVRFLQLLLREIPGQEALGISYGAAYLKAAPAAALTAEPFDAIATMAERLADAASAASGRHVDAMTHLEVVEQLGIHVRSFEHSGHLQICYDGELFHRVLSTPHASPEERARAVLGLTRPECVDPTLGILLRASQDEELAALLDTLDEHGLAAMTRSRIHARRATLWAAWKSWSRWPVLTCRPRPFASRSPARSTWSSNPAA